MGSEFGRTPKLSTLAESLPGARVAITGGRFRASGLPGGGVRGGTVVGSSDKLGAYPSPANPQTPENMAATI